MVSTVPGVMGLMPCSLSYVAVGGLPTSDRTFLSLGVRDLFALVEVADWSWREQTVDKSEKREVALGAGAWV